MVNHGIHHSLFKTTCYLSIQIVTVIPFTVLATVINCPHTHMARVVHYYKKIMNVPTDIWMLRPRCLYGGRRYIYNTMIVCFRHRYTCITVYGTIASAMICIIYLRNADHALSTK